MFGIGGMFLFFLFVIYLLPINSLEMITFEVFVVVRVLPNKFRYINKSCTKCVGVFMNVKYATEYYYIVPAINV